MTEPDSTITKSYGVLVCRTLVDTLNWSAKLMMINPGSDVVVLPPFSCVGNVMQVSAVNIAQTVPIRPEVTSHGPLSPHLEDILFGSHSSVEEGRVSLNDLLRKYNHVFPAPWDPVTGRTWVVRHEIETNGTRPVRCGPRRLAPAGLRTDQECVRDMLEGGGFIQVTVPGRHPLLICIVDLLRLLGRQQWFSTMDLASGYWQVAMSPDASRKAAFVTHEGLFQFRVMPFGLCNAPATFERLLSGMRWSRCLMHLDDVISFGADAPEALVWLAEVLERLSSFGLQLKAKKCTFMQTEVAFLGHIVGQDSL